MGPHRVVLGLVLLYVCVSTSAIRHPVLMRQEAVHEAVVKPILEHLYKPLNPEEYKEWEAGFLQEEAELDAKAEANNVMMTAGTYALKFLWANLGSVKSGVDVVRWGRYTVQQGAMLEANTGDVQKERKLVKETAKNLMEVLESPDKSFEMAKNDSMTPKAMKGVVAKSLLTGSAENAKKEVETMKKWTSTLKSLNERCAGYVTTCVNVFKSGFRKMKSSVGFNTAQAGAQAAIIKARYSRAVQFEDEVLCPALSEGVNEIMMEIVRAFNTGEEIQDSQVAKLGLFINQLSHPSAPASCQNLYRCGDADGCSKSIQYTCPKLGSGIGFKAAVEKAQSNVKANHNSYTATVSSWLKWKSNEDVERELEQALKKAKRDALKEEMKCLPKDRTVPVVLGNPSWTRALIREKLLFEPSVFGRFVDYVSRSVTPFVRFVNYIGGSWVPLLLFDAMSIQTLAGLTITGLNLGAGGTVVAVGAAFAAAPLASSAALMGALSSAYYLGARLATAKQTLSDNGFCARSARLLLAEDEGVLDPVTAEELTGAIKDAITHPSEEQKKEIEEEDEERKVIEQIEQGNSGE